MELLHRVYSQEDPRCSSLSVPNPSKEVVDPFAPLCKRFGPGHPLRSFWSGVFPSSVCLVGHLSQRNCGRLPTFGLTHSGFLE